MTMGGHMIPFQHACGHTVQRRFTINPNSGRGEAPRRGIRYITDYLCLFCYLQGAPPAQKEKE